MFIYLIIFYIPYYNIILVISLLNIADMWRLLPFRRILRRESCKVSEKYGFISERYVSHAENYSRISEKYFRISER